MRRVLVGVALFFCVAVAQPALAQRCEHARDIDLSAAAADVDLAVIAATAGSLRVEGGSGDDVVIAGRACASDADRLGDMTVTVDRRDDRIEIETEIPDTWGWSWLGSRYAYIDLHVQVPSRMAVELEDGSGNVIVRDVAEIGLSDGSGDIEITGIAGNVALADGSGNVHLTDIDGEIRIDDGSGSIDIRNAGSVVIEDDGSGSIDIDGVAGSVIVHRDGSGYIRVVSVRGDFTVERDGSGGIRHSDVAGRVSIPERN